VPTVGTSARLLLPHGGSCALEQQPVVVGRHPACGVVLDDVDVSRQHLRIEPGPAGQGHQVTDLGSTNGTVLNGTRLSGPAVLQDGDRLEVGGAVLGYQVQPA
jgi:pSer/pThr/pTyr-binding forkhead associated (FHA) protein